MDDVEPFPAEGRRPTIEVVNGDAVAWLRAHRPSPGDCLLSSLPDPAELSLGMDDWRAFSIDAADACLAAVPPRAVERGTRVNGRQCCRGRCGRRGGDG